MINTLLIGGKGTIGAGLRTFLPRLDSSYRVVSADLHGATDKATQEDAHREFIEFDASRDDGDLRQALEGRDLVIYLARKDPLGEMNDMTPGSRFPRVLFSVASAAAYLRRTGFGYCAFAVRR